jgi:DNA-binding XRE family transcriptional regulator
MWMLKNKDVGKRLKAARIEKGLNSRQFALKAGIDQSQYLKIEKGDSSITKKTMAKLVATYGLVQNYILYGKNVPNESVMEDNSEEYNVSVTEKVATHDALLSVLVNEVAALKSASSGEHSEVVIKKIYKAADDVVKLEKEE